MWPRYTLTHAHSSSFEKFTHTHIHTITPSVTREVIDAHPLFSTHTHTQIQNLSEAHVDLVMVFPMEGARVMITPVGINSSHGVNQPASGAINAADKHTHPQEWTNQRESPKWIDQPIKGT